jgi:hypothetical protein
MARNRYGTVQQQLLARLSPAALDELVREFGGRLIRVPAPSLLARRQRRWNVVQLLGTDATYSEVALAVGASIRTVKRDGKCSTGNT